MKNTKNKSLYQIIKETKKFGETKVTIKVAASNTSATDILKVKLNNFNLVVNNNESSTLILGVTIDADIQLFSEYLDEPLKYLISFEADTKIPLSLRDGEKLLKGDSILRTPELEVINTQLELTDSEWNYEINEIESATGLLANNGYISRLMLKELYALPLKISLEPADGKEGE